MMHAARGHRMGANARELARERFALPRFTREWNAAIERAIALHGRSA